ncbi:MAG: sulfite exporter TauE/SafE family protein [Flavobacteriaceae bacterium]|nr:sulfite exporter TauE/SafE family protein [Flavobacteriaceae bacterium]
MFHFQLYFIIFAAVVILLSSVIKGITGFGFALLAIPLLSLIFPLSLLVPAIVLFNLITSIIVLFNLKEKIKGYYIVPMIIASLAGIPLGVYLLTYLNPSTLKIVTSLAIIMFSIRMLSGVKLAKRNFHKPIVFAGFLSGVLTSSISIGGPPLAIALDRKGYSKEMFRGIFIWFMVFSSLFTTLAFYYKGLLTTDTIKFTAFSLPLLFIGSGWGVKIATKINQQQFRKFIILLNVCTGLLMLITTLIKLYQ